MHILAINHDQQGQPHGVPSWGRICFNHDQNVVVSWQDRPQSYSKPHSHPSTGGHQNTPQNFLRLRRARLRQNLHQNTVSPQTSDMLGPGARAAGPPMLYRDPRPIGASQTLTACLSTPGDHRNKHPSQNFLRLRRARNRSNFHLDTPSHAWTGDPRSGSPYALLGPPDPSGTQGPPKTSKQPQKHLTPPGIELGTTSAPCMAPGRISPRSYIELPLLSVLTESPAIWECSAGAHGRTCVEGTPRSWQLPLSCRSHPGL